MKHAFVVNLDDENPEERAAIEVIALWQEQGLVTETMIAKALLAMAEGKAAQASPTTIAASVREILKQMHDVISEIHSMQAAAAAGIIPPPDTQPEPSPTDPPSEEVKLSDVFLSAVKKTARPGLKLES
jgi:hypothetical protein